MINELKWVNIEILNTQQIMDHELNEVSALLKKNNITFLISRGNYDKEQWRTLTYATSI